MTPEKIEEFTKEKFPQYTPEELAILRERYTPEQMAALEAGEAAIDPKDLTIQGRLRRDPYRPPYLDDFSKVLPIVDKRAKLHPPPPEKVKFMSREEHANDLEKLIESLIPQDVNFDGMKDEEIEQVLYDKVNFDIAEAKYFEEHPALVGTDTPSNSAMAPGLGKNLRGVAGLYKPPVDPDDNGLDPDGQLQDLKKKTGLNMRHLKSFHWSSKTLVTRMVSNQTRLGKVQSFWILAIAGNRNGRLGVGEAKSTEAAVAIKKAKELAILNMQPIPRYEDRTIFGSVEAKVGATIVRLESRPPGKLCIPVHHYPPYLTSRTRYYQIQDTRTNNFSSPVRFWSPRFASSLRDVPDCRHPRYRGQDAPRAQPHELSQGVLGGADEPEKPQRDCHRPRQEAG